MADGDYYKRHREEEPVVSKGLGARESYLEWVFGTTEPPCSRRRWSGRLWSGLGVGCVDPSSDSVNLYGRGCGQENDVGSFPPGLQSLRTVPSDIDGVSHLEGVAGLWMSWPVQFCQGGPDLGLYCL